MSPTRLVAPAVLAAFAGTALGQFSFLILGGNVTIARGISADGNVVVGGSIPNELASEFPFRAFWRTSNQPAFLAGQLASTIGSAAACSADGSVVVGLAVDQTDFLQFSFRWVDPGPMIALPPISFSSFVDQAWDVSADGATVVGSSSSPLAGGIRHAYRWTSASGTVGLGDLTGSGYGESEGLGVSADGSVAVGQGTGTSLDMCGFGYNSANEGFRHSPPGPLASVGPGQTARLEGISADGVYAVGSWNAPDGFGGCTPHPAYHSDAEGLVLLDPPCATTMFTGTAFDASANGDRIVGRSNCAGPDVAFLYERRRGAWLDIKSVLVAQGAMPPLSGIDLFEAVAISDDGTVIAGNATSSEVPQLAWVAEIPPLCTADFDDGSATGTPDFSIDISDLLYYLALFDAGNLFADLDDGSGTGAPDGVVDISDLLYFLARFDAGC